MFYTIFLLCFLIFHYTVMCFFCFKSMLLTYLPILCSPLESKKVLRLICNVSGLTSWLLNNTLFLFQGGFSLFPNVILLRHLWNPILCDSHTVNPSAAAPLADIRQNHLNSNPSISFSEIFSNSLAPTPHPLHFFITSVWPHTLCQCSSSSTLTTKKR